jgi:hypothetical protein
MRKERVGLEGRERVGQPIQINTLNIWNVWADEIAYIAWAIIKAVFEWAHRRRGVGQQINKN